MSGVFVHIHTGLKKKGRKGRLCAFCVRCVCCVCCAPGVPLLRFINSQVVIPDKAKRVVRSPQALAHAGVPAPRRALSGAFVVTRRRTLTPPPMTRATTVPISRSVVAPPRCWSLCAAEGAVHSLPPRLLVQAGSAPPPDLWPPPGVGPSISNCLPFVPPEPH